jgi:hypothetical protein
MTLDNISDHNRIKLDLNNNNKKTQKIFKYMETEQHTAEKPVSN